MPPQTAKLKVLGYPEIEEQLLQRQYPTATGNANVPYANSNFTKARTARRSSGHDDKTHAPSKSVSGKKSYLERRRLSTRKIYSLTRSAELFPQ
jgi:hypothetical protein